MQRQKCLVQAWRWLINDQVCERDRQRISNKNFFLLQKSVVSLTLYPTTTKSHQKGFYTAKMFGVKPAEWYSMDWLLELAGTRGVTLLSLHASRRMPGCHFTYDSTTSNTDDSSDCQRYWSDHSQKLPPETTITYGYIWTDVSATSAIARMILQKFNIWMAEVPTPFHY